jgi:hypothetical protein
MPTSRAAIRWHAFCAPSTSCARPSPPETLVLPSHNLPFFGLHARIDALAAHHQARCEEVVAACASPRSAKELLPVLFTRPLDRHQTAFALGEALAHLHYLEAQDEIARVPSADGVLRFIRTPGRK